MAIIRLPATGDAPRTAHAAQVFSPGGEADSAGFAWAGRSMADHPTTFADDRGDTPEVLRSAVQRLRAAATHYLTQPAPTAAALQRLATAHTEAFAALCQSRVLVPLLTEAGDYGETPDGRVVEKTQELSIVTIAAPDGRQVMPVFSSVGTMRNWNAAARPVPVPMAQAALAAAQQQIELIIIDPGTPELELGVRRTQLEDVALGRDVRTPWASTAISDELCQTLRKDPHIEDIRLLPGDPQARLLAHEITVMLTLTPGLTSTALQAVVQAAGQRIAEDSVIAQHIDSLTFVLH